MTLAIQHDRLAQLLMKSDPTLGLDAARIQLERAAIAVSAGEAARTPWGQAALMTIAECGARSFRGGVYLKREFVEPACVGNSMPVPLQRLLLSAGGRSEEPPAHALHIHVGIDCGPEAKLACWTDGWIAIVGPSPASGNLSLGNELSGALAGSMAVTEAFRSTVLGEVIAGKRTQRLSPLSPQHPDPKGIELELLPSAMWILGIGNLGQALLWVLGLLPYRDPSAVHLVLQDTDSCGPENQDVQILTKPSWLGCKKVRAAAEWAGSKGFRTTVTELPFNLDGVRDEHYPGLAFVGVDNIQTRHSAARPEARFDLVIDAGLGATPTEVFDIRIHGFPGSRDAKAAWPDPLRSPKEGDRELGSDLKNLISQGRLDRCGALMIAGQPVGIPSTAVAAATIQIAQACRAIRTSRFCDLVDVSLTNPSRAVTHEMDFGRARVLLFEEARRPPRR